MFPSTSSSSEHSYDFHSEENAPKWRGLFVKALEKVQRQVHPSLTAKEDGLEYIERLILDLLQMLCVSQPHTVLDVEERVQKTFPHPIDKWAIGDAQNALDKGKKKSPLVLPVDKIHPLLKEVLGYKVDHQVTVYIVAVLEYIAADVLKLTGNYVKNIKHKEITLQDIKVAMCADKVLMDMFLQDDDDFTVEEDHTSVRRGSLTYEEIVKDFILEETQYMRDLNMIIKVFRAPFVRLFPRSKDLDVIFSNIMHVHALTTNLLSSLEDCLEAADENSIPLVGPCFEELAEGAEFDVYDKFAEDMLKPNGRERLNALIQRNDTNVTFQSSGRGFKDAVKYVLPKLLLGPIYHCLHYFDVIKALIETSNDEEDRECLRQALGVLTSLKVEIERKLSAANIMKRKGDTTTLRFQGRAEREAALCKMTDLQKSIDGWEGKNISQSCNEFLMEGPVQKYAGRRFTERYVFLFDSLIVLTKQNMKRSSVTGPVAEYKFKEKFNIRKIEIVDREDTEDMKHAFELQVPNQSSIILCAKTQEEKNNWMAALVSLHIRSNLERMLDSAIKEEEKLHPLKKPCPEQYSFAEEDSEENIVFEEQQDPGVESPLIKGGTIVKLVERLTFHTYADPKFVRTYLTTYRTFCKPEELLELLIRRFEIPEPVFENDGTDTMEQEMRFREDLKRFRKEYGKPIQFRVLNVLRHWVDQHWYDFEGNAKLLGQLNIFLESVKGKAMRKWVESINKIIYRRRENDGVEKQKQISYPNIRPTIEWHIAHRLEEYDLMTLHPVEIARQLTLLEFDLYRAVKPSEMVGSVWMKKNRNITSPKLLRMIQHSTRLTFWLEKCIVEADNFEERVAVVCRILEILMVFQELNNFNGIVEVVSALHSAPVYRLEHTMEEVRQKNHKLMKAYEEAQELNQDRFKRYIEKLRSIDPPCVPFMGMYLTNILLTEEGNPDFLPNRPEGIINFKKRRKVAEITGEIQQYQNQPYSLHAHPDIRTFFENLDPLGGMTEKELNDYLYEKSKDIEPRHSKQPTKYERKRDYTLKSPGIKTVSSRHSGSTVRNLPSALSPSPVPTRSHEDGDLDSLATPPTPSTPLTPPHHNNSDKESVFTMVYINPGSNSLAPSSATPVLPTPLPLQVAPGPGPPTPTFISKGTTAATSTASLSSGGVAGGLGPTGAEGGDEPPDLPPPLPPRSRRDRESLTNSSDLSPNRQLQEPPPVPRRADQAPPLPPRRVEAVDGHHAALTLRAMGSPNTASGVGRHFFPPTNMTLPRHNSDWDAPPPPPPASASAVSAFPILPNNRDDLDIPKLPPKTYKQHSRRPSS